MEKTHRIIETCGVFLPARIELRGQARGTLLAGGIRRSKKEILLRSVLIGRASKDPSNAFIPGQARGLLRRRINQGTQRLRYNRTFELHGKSIHLRTDHALLAKYLHAHWITEAPAIQTPRLDLEIEITQTNHPLSASSFSPVDGITVFASTDNLYAFIDERGASRQAVLKFHDPGNWDNFMLYVFAPFLGHLFRRLNFFELHSGAVALGQHGIIIPAQSGSGKTTTVISLIRSCFDFIADDHIYLQNTESGVEILGYPKHPALLDDSLQRFPELHFLKELPHIYRGGRAKRLFPIEQLERLYGSRRHRAPLKTILFPQIDLDRPVSLKALDAKETMLRMMKQEPWDYYGDIIDPLNVKKQMSLFKNIAETVRAYDLFLNPSVAEIPKVVLEMVKKRDQAVLSGTETAYAPL